MSVNKGRNWKMLYFSICCLAILPFQKDPLSTKLTFEKDQLFILHEHRPGAEGEPVKY